MQKTQALRVIEAFTACYYSSIWLLCSNSSKVVLLFFALGFDALPPRALSAGGKRCERTGESMIVVIFTCMGMNREINTGVKEEGKAKHIEMNKNIPKRKHTHTSTSKLMMNQCSSKWSTALLQMTYITSCVWNKHSCAFSSKLSCLNHMTLVVQKTNSRSGLDQCFSSETEKVPPDCYATNVE